MSDGSLSQDEIDALLLGGGGDSAPVEAPQSGASLSASEESAIMSLLNSVGDSQAATLSGMMGKTITVGTPNLEVLSKDSLQATMEDEVVEIKIDYKEGVVGEHLYYLSTADALKLAGPMIGQDDVELNPTAISAIGEAISQITGAVITVIGEKIGVSIMPDSPDGQSIPKAMIRAPQGEVVKIKYQLTIDGGESISLVEVFSLPLIKDIASRAGADSQPDMSGDMASMMGMGQPAGGMDFMGGQAAPPPQQNMGGQMGMGQQMGGQMGMGQQMGGQMGMGQPMMGMNQHVPNVQGVQLPDFGASVSPIEQRNIGLLMDVSMELTVELGRTKWQIKDILGMGEGTIVELDKLAGEPVDVLVNHNLIAKGEVVVIDENFGVRVTEIVSSIDRIKKS